MSGGILRFPWTTQPDASTPIDRANPLSKNLSLAFIGGQSRIFNPATNGRNTVTGSKIQTTQGGQVSGFNTTYGTGTTDRIDTSLTADSQKRSWFARVYLSSYVNSRIFDIGNNASAIGGNNLASVLVSCAYSGGQTPLYGYNPAPPLNTWVDLLITWDRSGTNLPIVYTDGVEQGLTNTGTLPSGTYTIQTTPLIIGNRADNARCLPGMVECAYVWDRILSPAEAVALTRNRYQLYQPIQRTIWVPAAAGGAFTPSITEAITLADTASQVASLSASISESLPLSHSQTALANFPATITEAATLSHSQDAIVGYAVSNTETLNLSHSQTNVANFPATITEAMTLADSGSVQFGATSTISEAMTLADSSSNVAALSASITESMTLADSPNASASGDYTATQTEAMSLADTASNVAALSASITAPMSLSDSQSNVASLSASISESMTLADTSSSSLSGAAYSATISEAMTLADTAAVQAALSAALTEAMSLGENATAAWMTYVSIVEAMNLSDSRDGGVDTAWTASITEALGLADTVSSGSIGSSVRLFTNDIAVLTVPVPLFATTKTVDLIATTQSEAVFLS